MNLKKNIRKILKENMDDLQWIRDIEVDPLKSGTLMFISPLNTNAVKWPHKNNNTKEYIVLRITDVTDGWVYYELIVGTSDDYRDGDIPLEDANKLINTGYWRVLSVNTPQEYITPGIKNYYNDKVESKDFLPYIIFDGEKMKLNQLKESDDLEWIRDLGPTLPRSAGDLKHFVGWNFLWDEETPHGKWNATIGKILYVSDEEVNYTTNTGSRRRVIGDFVEMIGEGKWVLLSPEGILFDPIYNREYPTPLKESNDLQWIIDTNPKDTEPKEGDKIRVHNLGTEESFLQWLSVYGTSYNDGDYGPFIEGEVINHEGKNFFIREMKTNDPIYFPNYKHIPILNNAGHKGLDLLYEFI